jgi:hypothetical protein
MRAGPTSFRELTGSILPGVAYFGQWALACVTHSAILLPITERLWFALRNPRPTTLDRPGSTVALLRAKRALPPCNPRAEFKLMHL